MKALTRNCTGYLLLALLGVCLVAFPPLAATLELHHALGEADQDGHQHSAADLCSWVQSHTSSSVVGDATVLASQPTVPALETPYSDRLVEHLLLTTLPARPSQSDPLKVRIQSLRRRTSAQFGRRRRFNYPDMRCLYACTISRARASRCVCALHRSIGAYRFRTGESARA